MRERFKKDLMGGDIDIDFIAFCFSHCNAWAFLLLILKRQNFSHFFYFHPFLVLVKHFHFVACHSHINEIYYIFEILYNYM